MKKSIYRYWKLLGLTTVMLITLASVAYAYWRINASPSPTLYVTATSPPLELRMELDKTEFQLNETVTIHLFLKNTGERTVTIFVPYLQHFFGFIVKDRNNTVVLNYPYGGYAAIDKVTLEPGDQINETLNWSQIGHYPDGSGGVYLHSVPLGTYHITGRTGEYLMDSLEGAEDWTPWIETPSIKITIS